VDTILTSQHTRFKRGSPDAYGTQNEHYLQRGLNGRREGLKRVLMALRRAEVNGDLIYYYLNLLEALERCREPAPEPDLALLLPECAQFLAHALVACMSRFQRLIRIPTEENSNRCRRASKAEARSGRIANCPLVDLASLNLGLPKVAKTARSRPTLAHHCASYLGWYWKLSPTRLTSMPHKFRDLRMLTFAYVHHLARLL
jgi:hypothetical protein